jgi:hypothetical protein
MESKKQQEVYQSLHEEIMEITKKKAHDYASQDVLSNFKGVSTAAKALGINIGKPEQYALFMVILKIARLTNLLNSGKIPNNESVDDSFKDGINYFKLAYCCYIDEK